MLLAPCIWYVGSACVNLYTACGTTIGIMIMWPQGVDLSDSSEFAVKTMSKARLRAKREFVRVGGRMQMSTALDKVRIV